MLRATYQGRNATNRSERWSGSRGGHKREGAGGGNLCGRKGLRFKGVYDAVVQISIGHWIRWITSRHTLERKHTNNETENSNKGDRKHNSTRKKAPRLSEAPTSKLGIPINQPLWGRWGDRGQPWLVGGSRNGRRVRSDRRSPFAWRRPGFCGSWRNDHRERR